MQTVSRISRMFALILIFVISGQIINAQNPTAQQPKYTLQKDEKKGMWGFKDSSGKWALQPKYTKIEPIDSNRYWRIFDGNKQGLYDMSTNKVIVKVDWGEIGQPFKVKNRILFPVERLTTYSGNRGRFWGVYNEEGKEIIKPAYENVVPVEEGEIILLRFPGGMSGGVRGFPNNLYYTEIDALVPADVEIRNTEFKDLKKYSYRAISESWFETPLEKTNPLYKNVVKAEGKYRKSGEGYVGSGGRSFSKEGKPYSNGLMYIGPDGQKYNAPESEFTIYKFSGEELLKGTTQYPPRMDHDWMFISDTAISPDYKTVKYVSSGGTYLYQDPVTLKWKEMEFENKFPDMEFDDAVPLSFGNSYSRARYSVKIGDNWTILEEKTLVEDIESDEPIESIPNSDRLAYTQNGKKGVLLRDISEPEYKVVTPAIYTEIKGITNNRNEPTQYLEAYKGTDKILVHGKSGKEISSNYDHIDLGYYDGSLTVTKDNQSTRFRGNGKEVTGPPSFTLTKFTTGSGGFSWRIDYEDPDCEFYKVEIQVFNSNGTPYREGGRDVLIYSGSQAAGMLKGYWSDFFYLSKGALPRYRKFIGKISVYDCKGQKVTLKDNKSLEFEMTR